MQNIFLQKTHSWPADEGIESWSIDWKDKSNNKMYLKSNEKRPNAQEESADPKTNPETIEENMETATHNKGSCRDIENNEPLLSNLSLHESRSPPFSKDPWNVGENYRKIIGSNTSSHRLNYWNGHRAENEGIQVFRACTMNHKKSLANLYTSEIRTKTSSRISSQGIERYKLGKDDTDKAYAAIDRPMKTIYTC